MAIVVSKNDTTEIKLIVEREIGRDFQVAWATKPLIMEIDVTLFDRFSA
ncbi:MAG: hypothetical protein JRJ37_03610 [Deltaproteobacteria bacterium]|nr:hypothetical protein [Deltaproteobacteria bacterium]